MEAHSPILQIEAHSTILFMEAYLTILFMQAHLGHGMFQEMVFPERFVLTLRDFGLAPCWKMLLES